MSNLTEKLEKAIENAKEKYEKTFEEKTKKEYDSLIETAERFANAGEFNQREINRIGYLETNFRLYSRKKEWLKESWEDRVANYAKSLKEAKRLSEEYAFLEWDKDKECIILSTGRINTLSKMMEAIPEYESKGDYTTLIGIKCLVELLEEGKI